MRRLALPLVLGITLSANAFAAIYDVRITNNLQKRPPPSTGGTYTVPVFEYLAAPAGILRAGGKLSSTYATPPTQYPTSASPGAAQGTQPANHLVGYSTFDFVRKGQTPKHFKCTFSTPASGTPIGTDIYASQLKESSCVQN